MMILIIILLLVYINNTNAAVCSLSCSPGQYCLTTSTSGPVRTLVANSDQAYDNVKSRKLLDSFSCEPCPTGQSSPGGTADISQCTATGNYYTINNIINNYS